MNEHPVSSVSVSSIDAVDDKLSAEQSFPGLRRFIRNRPAVLGTCFMLLMVGVMAFWPWLVPYPDDVADAVNFDRMLEPPSVEYWFGTDEAGRDILTRIMAGAGMSLSLGLVVIAVAIVVGVPLGMIAG